jgi:anti-anti-sigma factor
MLEIIAPDSCRLHGRLDMQNSAVLLRELMALGDKTTAKVLKLDVSQLESADSLLLAAILDMSRRLASMGGELRVTGLSAAMTGLARVYGIESLIELCVES